MIYLSRVTLAFIDIVAKYDLHLISTLITPDVVKLTMSMMMKIEGKQIALTFHTPRLQTMTDATF